MTAAVDTFPGSPAFSIGADFPASGAEPVTPDDTAELTNMSRALYVGVAGNLSVLMRDGSTGVFLTAGVGYHPLRVRRVNLTGTTAANIVSLY